MSANAREPGPDNDRRDNRRWLIGVVISLVFGLFGVVMALIGYWERQKPSTVPATRAVSAPHEARDAPREHRRERERN